MGIVAGFSARGQHPLLPSPRSVRAPGKKTFPDGGTQDDVLKLLYFYNERDVFRLSGTATRRPSQLYFYSERYIFRLACAG